MHILGLGWALIYIRNMKQRLTHSTITSPHGRRIFLSRTGQAFSRIGKYNSAKRSICLYYKQEDRKLHLEIDSFMGVKDGVTVSRDQIDFIINEFSKKQYAFHPSYQSNSTCVEDLQSWKHLIHVHIPKCAGTNFETPLASLPRHIADTSKNTKQLTRSSPKYNAYLWHGNLGEKYWHDAYLIEAFSRESIGELNGSFLEP